MDIKQWEDKNLAHFSYSILDEVTQKMILIDPARNPAPYIEYAKENKASIAGIIETHPHADFVSSHLELHQLTGATIYAHSYVGASYPHKTLDDGESISIGNITFKSIFTPGHSPDGICILLEEDGSQKAVFTGDTLFIGDCGRPDLREGAGNMKVTRNSLAIDMYHSLRNKLLPLNDDVMVYPAHGAGTLCGKGLSKDSSSTMGKEKATNWSLQEMNEEEFVAALLSDQPFVPAYFPYDVELNRKGAPGFRESIKAIKISANLGNEADALRLNSDIMVVDARAEKDYKKGFLANSVNLMEGTKFETWLGSIIKPGEKFYLAGEDLAQLKRLFERCAAIGYETQVEEAFVIEKASLSLPGFNKEEFRKHQDEYTIVDVRNPSEVKEGKPFPGSLGIPLAELRERVHELPTNKPVVVHCAAGYRSAAGSSIINAALKGKIPVYDMGEDIKEFSK